MNKTLEELYQQMNKDTDLIIAQTAPEGLDSNVILNWRQKQNKNDTLIDPMQKVIQGLALLGAVFETTKNMMTPQVAAYWKNTLTQTREIIKEHQRS